MNQILFDSWVHERLRLESEIQSALRACPQRQSFEVKRLQRRLVALEAADLRGRSEMMNSVVSEEYRTVDGMRERLVGIDQRFETISSQMTAARRRIGAARARILHANTRLAHALSMVGYLDLQAGIDCETNAPLLPPPPQVTSTITVIEQEPLIAPLISQAGARVGRPPETRLLVAVLGEAVESLRKNQTQKNRRERRLYREAINWLGVSDESPFSFAYICTMLGLEPDYIRRGVLGDNWRREIARYRA